MELKLQRGDKIGFFSPSSPITAIVPTRFERAKELNILLRDPEIKCIISTIGGLNSNSLLPYIDYEAFKKNPKIIIGYSDVTAILLGIYAKTGITTFYGPALVASFGEFPPFVEETFSYFEDILIKKSNLPYQYKKPEFWTDEMIDWKQQDRSKILLKNEWITLKEGKVTGRVIGGNLSTIMGFWGSQ